MTHTLAYRMSLGLLLSGWLLVSGAQAQTIRAVTETTPWTYLRDGRPAGLVTEIVEMTLQRAGFSDYRLAVYPWARAYDMALHEPGVLIFMIARTPAREPLFKWVGEFMALNYHLFRLKGRDEIGVSRLADARAYTVGVLRDDVRHQYLQANGHTRLVVSAESIDNFRKLLNRQVDLVVLTETEAASLCEQLRIDCGRIEKVHTLRDMSTGLYMAYSAATPDAIVERTRLAFDQVKATGALKKLPPGK
ncbi:transporter substrate-binding domain-containing protein [Schlegelella sp. S2-27]|uniref:Transporter substrate-binding domain-containing protein n=1 Tax=Caldimonas mangrovi TaxID=2944811 RepID=A0ABT0YXI5_9BURK|nr:transporter substrate-binding domain-containing protein [Caldimonas mangrovi]MCM5682891.1 transporter substrate-binding domain-containing protein [Caldimonas mangrovi]